MKRLSIIFYIVSFLIISSFGDNSETISFEDVKTLGSNSTILFVDVREPSEIKETGLIPGSINIPLKSLKYALEEMPSEEFKATYGRDHPTFDTNIVFTCRSGNRSKQALNLALSLGYKNVRHYADGWVGWSSKNKAK